MTQASHSEDDDGVSSMSQEAKFGAEGIAEAAAWRLIGLLLERPRARWHDEVAALAHEVRDASLRAAAEHAAQVATEGEYLRLLGPGGLVSPREVTYRRFDDPGRILADLVAIYEAFAFRPQIEEPIDHISVEAGFVGYMLLKQAFAEDRGEERVVQMVAAAREKFLAIHLAPVAATFAQRLKAAGASYLIEPVVFIADRVPAPPPANVAGALMTTPGDCGSCSGT